MKDRRVVFLIWLTVYLVSVALITDSLWHARTSVIERFEAAKGTSSWREWQSAVEQMGPIGSAGSRRPPPGREPPSLVLLRDYFPTCLLGILCTFTALFVVLATLVNGAINTRRAVTNLAVTTQGKSGRLMV